MRKTLISEQKIQRRVLCHGTRAVLVLECELPCLDTAAVRHAKAISEAIFAYAEREYLPVAANELETLVGMRRGFAFLPHRLRFSAQLSHAGVGLLMELALCYTVGGEVRLAQCTQSYWTKNGAYRRRGMTKKMEFSDK